VTPAIPHHNPLPEPYLGPALAEELLNCLMMSWT